MERSNRNVMATEAWEAIYHRRYAFKRRYDVARCLVEFDDPRMKEACCSALRLFGSPAISCYELGHSNLVTPERAVKQVNVWWAVQT